jgi:TonB family protein
VSSGPAQPDENFRSGRALLVSNARMPAILLVLLAVGATAQTPPRDPRPSSPAAQATAADAKLRAEVAAHPDDPVPRINLSHAQETRGDLAGAEATLIEAKRALPGNKTILVSLAAFYNRTGRFEQAMAALQDAAALDPGDPAGHQLVAAYFWEKASKDQTLSEIDRRRYIEEGLAAADRALAAREDYVDAMVYKNILLRMLARSEADPARQRTLMAEADTLRNRAMTLQSQRQPPGTRPAIGPPPPPPPPPPDPGVDPLGGQAPVRVGGNIPVPTKIRDVKPVYPPEAEAARVQGVVILEATIGADGGVVDAKVLRSIPLLDQAAMDAVRQWRFTPTRLNGQPVPVILTLTVNFLLQ